MSRHVSLSGTYNVRDVGGYPTRDGRHTRWGTLFRADSLHRLSDAAQVALLERGIRTIVDLRHGGEMAAAPNVFAASERVQYVPLPLLEDPALRTDSEPSVRGLGETYQFALETRGTQLVDVLRRFAQPEALPAVVHCTAGKDRTGLVIALVLSAIGVADEIIAEDYALSAEYLVGTYFDEARERAERRGVSWESYRQILVCPAPLMLETLEWLRQRYGSIDDYLKLHGLTPDERETLRERLTE